MKDGVYTPEIREGLLQTIRKNRDLYPELFNKWVGGMYGHKIGVNKDLQK